MAARVHETAIVDARAVLADDVEVGPYCVIGADVVVGAGTKVRSHVVIEGPTRIGARCEVFSFAALGGPPQDRTHAGEPTELAIGDDTVIREHVTIHRGTRKDRGITRVGARTLLMVGTHVAHDCIVGDDCTVANGCQLAGHVVLEDGVTLGGVVALAPFVRVGAIAFVAAGAQVEQSVPPFHIAQGDRARVRGLNHVGLERRAVPSASIHALTEAHRLLYRDGLPLAEALKRLVSPDPRVQQLRAFLETHTTISSR